MLASMTTIVIGPNDKISGTCVVTPSQSDAQQEADRPVRDADDTEQENQ